MRRENRKEVCPGGPLPVLPRPGPRPSAGVWWSVSPSLPPLPNSRLCQASVPRISSRCFLNTVGPQITQRLEAPHSTQCKIYTPLLTPQKLNYSWPSAAGEGWTPAPAPSSARVRALQSLILAGRSDARSRPRPRHLQVPGHGRTRRAKPRAAEDPPTRAHRVQGLTQWEPVSLKVPSRTDQRLGRHPPPRWQGVRKALD